MNHFRVMGTYKTADILGIHYCEPSLGFTAILTQIVGVASWRFIMGSNSWLGPGTLSSADSSHEQIIYGEGELRCRDNPESRNFISYFRLDRDYFPILQVRKTHSIES